MKIYISCVRGDREFGDSLADALKSINPKFEFCSYHMRENIGDDFREVVSSNIRTADAVIAIISPRYHDSRYGLLELDWALAYFYEKHSPVLLPIIIDNATPPTDLMQFLYLDATKFKSNNMDYDINSIALKISESLISIDVQNKENTVKEFTTRLDDDGAKYIQETTKRLEKQVTINKILSFICYGICFLLLCVCIYFCWIELKNTSVINYEPKTLIKHGLTSIVLISLVIATARFMFTLGKSFMVEAIRNMDRIHAIDFGNFYLKLFKEKFEWSELKEILQNWNIDKGSAFISQDTKDIDPSVLSAIVELYKNIGHK